MTHSRAIHAPRHVFAVAVMIVATTRADREARAEDPPRTGRTSALSWVRQPGAEGCIGAPALASAVEGRLRRRVFVPPADAEVSVEGTIARVGRRGFKATFRVADRDGKVLGSRDLEKPAESCDALSDDLALVLSVLIDPDAATATPEDGAVERPAEAAAPPPAPASIVVVEAPPPSPPPPPTPWRWIAGVDFGGSAGIVPKIGWVVGGSIVVTPPHWPGLRARAASFLPESHPIVGSTRADVSLVTGELGVCPFEIDRSPFGLTLCVGGMVGQLAARGENFDESRVTSAVFGAAVVDAMAELDVSRLVALTLTPALVVPLSRASLAYDDAAGARQTFYETSAVGASVSLGVAVGVR